MPSFATLRVIGVASSSSSSSSPISPSSLSPSSFLSRITTSLSPLRIALTFVALYLFLQLTFFAAVVHRHAIASDSLSSSSSSSPSSSSTITSNLISKNVELSSGSVGQSSAAIASGVNGVGGHALPHMSLLSHTDVNDIVANDNEINVNNNIHNPNNNNRHHHNNNNALDRKQHTDASNADTSSSSSSAAHNRVQQAINENYKLQQAVQEQPRHAINRAAPQHPLPPLHLRQLQQQQQQAATRKKQKDENVNNPIIGLLPRSPPSLFPADPNSTCHFFNDDDFLSHRFSLHMPTFEMWFYQNRGISMFGGDHAQQAENERKQRALRLSNDGHDEAGYAAINIDIVYTYVNGSDPYWLDEMNKHYRHDAVNTGNAASSTSIFNKYREWNEFRYSLRSVWKYGRRLFRNIIVVVASPSQIPHWLNTSHPQIKIVFHQELFARAARELPTFNSLAIESYLHHIPNLSDNFLYFNNDLLLGNYVTTSDFIDTEKKIYFQYADYPIRYNLACEMLMRNSPAYPFTLRSIMHTDCVNDPLFANTLLSKYYFDVLPSHWYMHIPHLWNKRILGIMEERMERLFSESRMNRFRCSKNDIMLHLQYESLRANLSASSSSNTDVAELAKQYPNDCLDCKLQKLVVSEMNSAAHHELYVYVVFMNHDHDKFYDNLREKMDSFHPKFIGIDDDLKEPSMETMAFHRNSLHDFFQQYWPTKPPWELD